MRAISQAFHLTVVKLCALLETKGVKTDPAKAYIITEFLHCTYQGTDNVAVSSKQVWRWRTTASSEKPHMNVIKKAINQLISELDSGEQETVSWLEERMDKYKKTVKETEEEESVTLQEGAEGDSAV